MDRDRILMDLGKICDSMMGDDLFNPVHIRYTVTLDHDADDELMKKAWDRTKRVYPLIDSVIGFDSDNINVYLDPETREQYMDDHVYLMKPNGGVNDPVKTKVPIVPGTDLVGDRVICISYYERTVSIGSYHTLVDGGGMNMVFNTFLYCYLALYTGHEDENPVVELTEGREPQDYYVSTSPDYLFTREYTPVPLYTLPLNCKGFIDKDMVNDINNIYSGSIAVSFTDFLKFCKKNGANPSSMICTLLAKAAYALNPDEEKDIVFQLTVSARKVLGLERSIANTVGLAFAYTTRDEVMSNTIDRISQRIRKDVDSQRTKDYHISYCRVFDDYRHQPKFKSRIITYIGSLNIGDNNAHIVDFSMGTYSYSNLYMMQLNDKFIITLQYGMATEKYLNEFGRIFSELGIKSEISHHEHYVCKDSKTVVL